jgi:5-methylcytosine-specific restriction endonuclease McrA
MQRDNWTCTRCGDNMSQLQVHHFYYNFDLTPWEYPADSMTTYCELCHSKHHFYQWLSKEGRLVLLKQGFSREDVDNIRDGVTRQLSVKPITEAFKYMDDIKNLVYA